MTQNDPKNWTKETLILPPAAYNAQNAASVDVPIDTLGFRYAMLTASLGAIAADWTIVVTGSATAGGSFVAISGATFAITNAGADDRVMVGIIDLHGEPGGLAVNRWLGLGGTGAAGVDAVGITVTLFNPKDSTNYIDRASGGADELTFEV